MGILITYTWRPEGQLFAIREGKNFIGAGNVSSDASHRPCDILITNDPRLSSEHALILCRHGRYDIVDQESSNGTFLNSELVPLQGTDLPNYAEIKTGSTVWTFIKINPPASEVIQPSPERKVEKPTTPSPESPDKTQTRVD
jgi:pSer/pThr/pTyr-binding forkhead associated (FHA) protein